MANRQGLTAGAIGTGKAMSRRVLAERFSAIGLPVYLADVKGAISGMAKTGSEYPKCAERMIALGSPAFAFQGCPDTFGDFFGQAGHPACTTIGDLGALLLSRMLNLNVT